MRRTCALIFLLLAATFATSSWARMNIVVINTDDQRFDSIARLPNISSLAAQGVTFTNAYQATPLCGPSRASMFSGGYLSQNTGVLENTGPNGGPGLFDDRVTLGTVLQAAGYRTQFVGKWLNGYEGMGRYVPPGWTRWVGRKSFATRTSWFAFKYVTGSSDRFSSGTGNVITASQYTTFYERDEIMDFIGRNGSGQPFFVFWNPSAPHELATPAPADAGMYSTYQYRGRGYGETDLGDKPRWVRQYSGPVDDDEFVRDQMRSLHSVDRSVAAIVDKLRSTGQLDNTLIVFTSDNGYMWGEHGVWAKIKPYEESTKVPLVVVMPGVSPRTERGLVSVSLDLGPTLYEIAGTPRQTDGRSLVPLLRNPDAAWRSAIYLENYGSSTNGNSTWAGVRNQRWKYIKYWTGEEELYDLDNDPFELDSRHRDSSLATLKASLRAQTDQQLGLAMRPVRPLPAGRLWTTYSYQFETWSGKAPFTWGLYSGSLPPGLTLDSTTGLLRGLPTATGVYKFRVKVADAGVSTHAQKPRVFVSRALQITVS